MKSRLLSLILALAVVASTVTGLTIVYQKTAGVDAGIAVISDLHIVSDEYFTQQNFQQYTTADKLLHLSEAILKSVVDELIADKKIKTVLVTGDLTEDGDIASQYAVERILRKLLNAGKQVFIISGNHDGLKRPEHHGVRADATLLREIYHDYGYKQAIEKDTRSLSYVADINSKYRIIAIDNDSYLSPDLDGPKEETDAQLVEWTKKQVEKCIADGKTPLAMAHKPLVGHMPSMIGDILGMGSVNDDFKQLAAALADNGCNYIFTGHLHGQDIVSYTSPAGNTLLDIETGSLLFVPNAYRIIKFTPNEARISSKRITSINMDYVSLFNSPTVLDQIKEDFRAYSVAHFYNAIEGKVTEELSVASLTKLLGASESMLPLVELLGSIVEELFTMPLYGNSSLNKIITDHGGEALPQTDYKSLSSLAAFFVYTINNGDERLDPNQPELVILKQGIKTLFYLLEVNKNEFDEFFPGIATINIDVERLFSTGELEVIDSGVIEFVYQMFIDKLPTILQNMSFKNLTLIGNFAKAFLNNAQEGLGDAVHTAIGLKHLNIDILMDDVVYRILLSDALHDAAPADNNVIISRTTLQEK